jgi:hypothetical protein
MRHAMQTPWLLLCARDRVWSIKSLRLSSRMCRHVQIVPRVASECVPAFAKTWRQDDARDDTAIGKISVVSASDRGFRLPSEDH